MSNEILKQSLKSATSGAYDLQKLRIQIGNRIAANRRSQLGLEPSQSEKDDKEAAKFLTQVRAHYDLICEGLVKFPTAKQFAKRVADNPGAIGSYADLILVSEYVDMLDAEKSAFKRLAKILPQFPIWNEFLEDVTGCGTAMSAVIISCIDISKATYPSSVWKYAGLDVVVKNGKGEGRNKTKDHLVPRSYTNSEGETKETVGITFNPFLKSKLMGVLAGGFLKQNAKYKEVYDNYKHRIRQMPAHADKTDKHTHNMALRYMMKRFLVDLYTEWRQLEGLPVASEYSEGKLGMKHRQGPQGNASNDGNEPSSEAS